MCFSSFEARHQIHKQKEQNGGCWALEGTEDQDSGGTESRRKMAVFWREMVVADAQQYRYTEYH